MACEDFNWNGDVSVVIPRQLAVAVYVNNAGEIVVRQEDPEGHDDDALLFIHPQHAQQLADAILKAAAEVSGVK